MKKRGIPLVHAAEMFTRYERAWKKKDKMLMWLINDKLSETGSVVEEKDGELVIRTLNADERAKVAVELDHIGYQVQKGAK